MEITKLWLQRHLLEMTAAKQPKVESPRWRQPSTHIEI